MKKRLVMLLLSVMMLLGMSVTAYAGEEGASFRANSMQMTAESYSVDPHIHKHSFRVHIKVYTSTYSKSDEVDADRLFTGNNTTSKKTTLFPETYNDGTYIGRYFKGDQKCTITFNGEMFEYTKTVE